MVANSFSIKQNPDRGPDGRSGRLPVKIAGAAVEVIKLPGLISKVKKSRLKMGKHVCSSGLL